MAFQTAKSLGGFNVSYLHFCVVKIATRLDGIVLTLCLTFVITARSLLPICETDLGAI